MSQHCSSLPFSVIFYKLSVFAVIAFIRDVRSFTSVLT